MGGENCLPAPVASRILGIIPSACTFEAFYSLLHVTRETYGAFEGEWIYTYSKSLIKAGWQVVIFQFSSRVQALEVTDHKSGARVFWIPCRDFSSWAKLPIGGRFLPHFLTTWFSQLRDAVKTAGCEVLYIQEYWLSRLDAITLMKLKLPLIAAYHGEKISKLAKPLKSWTFERVDAFTALTKAEMDRFTLQHPQQRGKMQIIPNWLDRESIREDWEYRRLTSRPIVLFIGRMEKIKGFAVLIEAMRTIDCEVWAVGTGVDEEALRRLAERL